VQGRGVDAGCRVAMSVARRGLGLWGERVELHVWARARHMR